jgi:hypothetical protein
MRDLSFLLSGLAALGLAGCIAPPPGATANAPGGAAAGSPPAPGSPQDLSKPLIVWNGDNVNPKSDRWSSCDSQPCTVKYDALPKVGMQESTGLEGTVKVSAGYCGFGWNWTSWYNAGATDVTGRKALKFNLRITSTSKEVAPDLKAMRIGLRCAKSKNCGVIVENLGKYAPEVGDGAWHEVAIPLTDMKTENKDEWDTKSVWEIGLHEWQPTPREFVFYLDDIRFE